MWEHMHTEDQEKAVGREKFSDFELEDEDKFKNAHNVASKLEIDGVEQKIVRRGRLRRPGAGAAGLSDNYDRPR
ncbi:hypothetical protein WP50_08960 [Lactiplantibacillus plantarum]|nr:hypothetical protein WP50_08960 [Lactiplantibacillus plantarum]